MGVFESEETKATQIDSEFNLTGIDAVEKNPRMVREAGMG